MAGIKTNRESPHVVSYRLVGSRIGCAHRRAPQVSLLFAVPTCGVVGEPDRGNSQGLLELVLPNRTLRKDALRKSHFFLLSRRAVWSESQTGERVRDSWNSSFPDRDASGHLKPAARSRPASGGFRPSVAGAFRAQEKKPADLADLARRFLRLDSNCKQGESRAAQRRSRSSISGRRLAAFFFRSKRVLTSAWRR